MQILLLLAALALPQAPCDDPASDVSFFELPSTERIDAAVAALLTEKAQAARREPASASAHLQLGMVLEANLMHAHARDAYRRAVSLDPEDPLLRYRLGVLESVTGDPVAARANLRSVVAERDDLLAAHARLAAVAFDLGELEEAELHWRRAIALEQELYYPSSRIGLASVWLELDRATDSLALVEQTLQMAPTYRHGHFVLGQVLLALDRVDDAEVELRRGEDSSASFPPGPHQSAIAALAVGRTGQLNLAGDHLAAGRVDAALAILVELVTQDPGDPLLLMRLARAYAAAGRFDAALLLLHQTVEAHPDQPELLLALARTALAALDRVPADELRTRLSGLALWAADRSCAIAPNHGTAHLVRGLVRDRALSPPNPQAVLEDLLAARRLGCRASGLAERIARSYASLGEVTEALRYAELSARENAFDPGAHLFLAQARALSNDRAGAAAAWERAYALAPERADVLELGRALAGDRR